MFENFIYSFLLTLNYCFVLLCFLELDAFFASDSPLLTIFAEKMREEGKEEMLKDSFAEYVKVFYIVLFLFLKKDTFVTIPSSLHSFIISFFLSLSLFSVPLTLTPSLCSFLSSPSLLLYEKRVYTIPCSRTSHLPLPPVRPV